MARVEIKNDSLNVHWILHFMDSSVKDVLGEDEVFKEAEKLWESGAMSANTSHSIQTYGKRTVLNSLSLGLGLSYVIVGIVGLYFKIKEKSTKRASKWVKGSVSIWCCLVGISLIISEINFGAEGVSKPVKGLIDLANRVSVFALKNHSVVVFSFQNILIYFPFYFQERKKKLTKLLVRLTFSQWAFSFCAPMIFAMSFILSSLNDCSLILSVTFTWQCIYQGILIFCYLGAFILSIIYMIGFYKENKADISSTTSRRRSIRQTMVACSVEVICDLAALAYHIFFNTKCSSNVRDLDLEVAINLSSHSVCDVSVKIGLLNPGVAKCILFAMLIQQIVQESIFLVAVAVDWKQKRKKRTVQQAKTRP